VEPRTDKYPWRRRRRRAVRKKREEKTARGNISRRRKACREHRAKRAVGQVVIDSAEGGANRASGASFIEAEIFGSPIFGTEKAAQETESAPDKKKSS